MSANSFLGTPSYMSPQVAERTKYTNKTDVWSTGVVFIAMVTLKNPLLQPYHFKGLDPQTIVLSDDRLKPFRHCICFQMVVADQDARASVDELIANPIFNRHFSKVSKKADAWLIGETISDEDSGEEDCELSEEMKAKLQLTQQQVDDSSQVS